MEAAAGRQAHRAEGAPVGCPDRRRHRHRRHPRARRGRRADRGTARNRHHQRGVQAGHRGPDQVGHQDRRRGPGPRDHRSRRGRPRRWPPLVGGPRRPARQHLLGPAQAGQPDHLRRWWHRHARARRRVPVRPLGRDLRLPADAGRRHPGRHRRHGHPRGHHLASGQAAPGRHQGHRSLGRRR